jgi:hypothetical protein
MNMYEEVEVWLHVFLTWTLDVGGSPDTIKAFYICITLNRVHDINF